MKKKLYVYYDEEGDFLEINMGKYTKGYFRDIGPGLIERVDEKTGKITGFGILSFKKRIAKSKEIEVDLPFKMELKQAI